MKLHQPSVAALTRKKDYRVKLSQVKMLFATSTMFLAIVAYSLPFVAPQSSIKCWNCSYTMGSGADTASCAKPTSGITPTCNGPLCSLDLSSATKSVTRACSPDFMIINCLQGTTNDVRRVNCLCRTEFCNDEQLVVLQQSSSVIYRPSWWLFLVAAVLACLQINRQL